MTVFLTTLGLIGAAEMGVAVGHLLGRRLPERPLGITAAALSHRTLVSARAVSLTEEAPCPT